MFKKVWLIIALMLLLTLASCGSDTGTSGSPSSTQAATSAPTSTPTATPTPHVQKWTTVQHFSGNGSKKTQIFTVPDDYKILYTCAGGTYGSYLSATIYDDHNAYVDGAVNVACDAGKTVKGETEEHQAGSIYLDILGSDQWTIAV